jgi:hypothetical protein
MRAGLAGGGARKVTLIPVGANADWYETKQAQVSGRGQSF